MQSGNFGFKCQLSCLLLGLVYQGVFYCKSVTVGLKMALNISKQKGDSPQYSSFPLAGSFSTWPSADFPQHLIVWKLEPLDSATCIEGREHRFLTFLISWGRWVLSVRKVERKDRPVVSAKVWLQAYYSHKMGILSVIMQGFVNLRWEKIGKASA